LHVNIFRANTQNQWIGISHDEKIAQKVYLKFDLGEETKEQINAEIPSLRSLGELSENCLLEIGQLHRQQNSHRTKTKYKSAT